MSERRSSCQTIRLSYIKWRPQKLIFAGEVKKNLTCVQRGGLKWWLNETWGRKGHGFEQERSITIRTDGRTDGQTDRQSIQSWLEGVYFLRHPHYFPFTSCGIAFIVLHHISVRKRFHMAHALYSNTVWSHSIKLCIHKYWCHYVTMSSMSWTINKSLFWVRSYQWISTYKWFELFVCEPE